MISLLIPDMPTADELLPYLRRIDEAKWYSNRGPLVQELEVQLADVVGGPVVTVNNGTVALELALRALRLPRGSLVLVPAMTFVATAQAVWNAQLRPALCDVDKDSWQMTSATAEEGIQGQAIRAVVPVATFGEPVPTEAWEVFSRHARLPIVIDAAGALTEQRAARNTRVTTVYSLHTTKSIGAGEGGIVASHDGFALNQIRKMTSFGHWGTNAKMSEYHAAVALASLDRHDRKMRRIHPIAQAYIAQLPKSLTLARIPRADTTTFCVLLPEGKHFTQVGPMLLELGIQTKQWYRPFVDELPQFVSSPRAYAMPVTQMLRDRMIGLPFHSSLSLDDVAYICDALKRICP